VLAGAAGSVVWGAVADRIGRRRPRDKLKVVAVLCLLAMAILVSAFAAPAFGFTLTPSAQFGLILAGGFVMTCTVGPVSAVVIDVVHPGVRATGASVLSLFQNLFGLAAGPLIAGALSDALGLSTALAITPLFGIVAALAFVRAAQSYESDLRAVQPAPPADDPQRPAVNAERPAPA
jgi:MFS transporter, Spinster family, sphingosine-1-phosphate transporter